MIRFKELINARLMSLIIEWELLLRLLGIMMWNRASIASSITRRAINVRTRYTNEGNCNMNDRRDLEREIETPTVYGWVCLKNQPTCPWRASSTNNSLRGCLAEWRIDESKLSCWENINAHGAHSRVNQRLLCCTWILHSFHTRWRWPSVHRHI